ncbi:hypothetical protein ETAA8_27040 [Anatilimnocola aggregata]|uniref:Uncharacterized protein n=1 Tax=Anatilimnocola aggregata TaxID=2528021 RepID=A0A517YBJ0_9BACT|nr:hypothetical protein ETAA8_27040 [Anatilimnocola aggregata]
MLRSLNKVKPASQSRPLMACCVDAQGRVAQGRSERPSSVVERTGQYQEMKQARRCGPVVFCSSVAGTAVYLVSADLDFPHWQTSEQWRHIGLTRSQRANLGTEEGDDVRCIATL